ncbi:MAG: hypothetical protein KAW47_04235 [Thermoplasmatales archaeon]|nr:hypothetical protein [Thermoplasmatales archaeon]
MHCRVGITTNPDRRRDEWQDKVIGFRNWKIVNQFDNRDAAQAFENQYAREHGCEAHPGGDEASGIWHVYYFEFVMDR